jgi:CDP-glycerol glycerophosphotransferase (TagB/SpsB family)
MTIARSGVPDSWRRALTGGRRAVGFDLASLGELQFVSGILHLYAERYPNDRIYVFHHQSTEAAFDERCPALRGRVVHVKRRQILRRRYRRLDLYVTTEQFMFGPPTVYTLTVFHGQPSKGVTFRHPQADPFQCNDGFFLYGPLHRQALQEHLDEWRLTLPTHLSLFDIGYSKSDDLINGKFDRNEILREMNLDAGKKTILYAPAFNAGASLRENGVEIIDTLCGLTQFNVIAKLPIDVFQPTSDLESTGGVDWPAAIGDLERRHANFRLDRRLEANPALACSDVLITCVSSIAFEFLAIGRPVIYLDTPAFFSETLRAWFPGRDVSCWANRTVVNGGREFGLVVSTPSELPAAIDDVLDHPQDHPRQPSALRDRLLYNPGRATEAAVDQIGALLGRQVRASRPDQGLTQLREQTGYLGFGYRVRAKVRRMAVTRPRRLVARLLNAAGLSPRAAGAAPGG